MPLQDRIAHAAAVAKWKADQQVRLMKSQGRINEIEGRIRTQKASLADRALALFAQGQLTEEELKQICADIAALHGQIKEQQSLQETIRNERPPEQQAYSSTYPPPQPTEVQNTPLSGLVCPECHRPLVGRFCPVHGLEGVAVEPKQTPEPQPTDSAAPVLVCPECGKPLSVRFCPEHGVEGVPLAKPEEG